MSRKINETWMAIIAARKYVAVGPGVAMWRTLQFQTPKKEQCGTPGFEKG